MTVQRRSKERERNGGEAEAENAARKRGSNTRGEQAGAGKKKIYKRKRMKGRQRAGGFWTFGLEMAMRR